MNFGEIVFDMNYVGKPTYGQSTYLLKRWKRYSIYAKSGSNCRTENPSDNVYQSASIYLYDYVAVSSTFWNQLVYTSSIIDSTPGPSGTEYGPTNLWQHYANTFKNSPNATTNNYLLTPNQGPIRLTYSPPYIYTDNGEYFELVGGYPRNHYTHKRNVFSLESVITYVQNTPNGVFKKNSQSINTTVGQDGNNDGSVPIQSIPVSNLNLIENNSTLSS